MQHEGAAKDGLRSGAAFIPALCRAATYGERVSAERALNSRCSNGFDGDHGLFRLGRNGLVRLQVRSL